MRLLVLGGTRFLGRHFVAAALGAGCEVTALHRGRTPNPFGEKVQVILADRDPLHGGGPAALPHADWDAIVDFSGYLPRVVGAWAEALAGRARRYLFVSSISVYQSFAKPFQRESAALAQLDDPASEDIPTHYGALKAASEAEVEKRFGAGALVVRPGLIVGPFDPSDRFPYWAARFGAPELLGERGKEVVVPAPLSLPVQLIDARDLARWMLYALENDLYGTFNASSPAGAWTFQDLIDAGLALAEKRHLTLSPYPIDETLLEPAGVEPWMGLPVWVGASDPKDRELMRIDCSKAEAAGLHCRPMLESLTDTLDWLLALTKSERFSAVLSAGAERALVATQPRQ